MPAAHAPQPGRNAIFFDLFRALSHEINQPLTSMLGNAQAAKHLLDAKRIDRFLLRTILQDIVNQNRRAAEVLNRARNLLRCCETRLHPVHLRDVVEETLMTACDEMMTSQVAVRAYVASGLPPVQADPAQLRQVLLTVIRNARESAGRNPYVGYRTIEIRAAIQGDAVCISVESFGPVGSADHGDRPLHAFFAGWGERTELSLAACRLIVAAHDGLFWTTSRPGRGSTIHFTVPILREKRI